MKMDYIIKEELWRSIAVYFFAFLGIGYLIMGGYLNVNISATFVLAFIVTIVHFLIKVWYRRR
ncbi:MAG: hypothetical protein U9N36_05740 [Euryarchaeota archaeon]|nr:hypothetical protein [Euryarchaeota archaeon]